MLLMLVDENEDNAELDDPTQHSARTLIDAENLRAAAPPTALSGARGRGADTPAEAAWSCTHDLKPARALTTRCHFLT